MPSQDHIFTVSEITAHITRLLRDEFPTVTIQAEISNFRISPAGHAYFRLKDDQATLSAVMFRWPLSRLAFKPADGMRVVVEGGIDVYAPQGSYQIKVEAMREVGMGDLHLRFLQLKEKLEAEGLFSPDHKTILPKTPRRVGVVTSPTGAAVRDILSVLDRRFSNLEIIIAPTRVQGTEAPDEIVHGIEQINRLGADVMIVGRGGGSLEDLMAFNDERVARAIFASQVPIISAVGHETDFTIADFVADLRAPTPSAAAEIVVEEREAIIERMINLRRRLVESTCRTTESARLRWESLAQRPVLRQPLAFIHPHAQRLDSLSQNLRRITDHRVSKTRLELDRLRDTLRTLSPEGVMARGYSVVTDATGAVISDTKQVKASDPISIRLKKGSLEAEVKKTKR